jgi:5-methylcytosine-specific restriction endonuclease McrA
MMLRKKKKIKKSKKPKRSTLVKKLDRLFSAVIHKRDEGQCQMCGREVGKMDCSHIYSRRCSALRWDMNNAVLKCVRCHKYDKLAWHQSPLSVALKFIRKFPARAEYLREFEWREVLCKDWTIPELLFHEAFLKDKLEGMDQ